MQDQNSFNMSFREKNKSQLDQPHFEKLEKLNDDLGSIINSNRSLNSGGSA